MSKIKKKYCCASFIFAVTVLFLTISLCIIKPEYIFATTPDEVTTSDITDGLNNNRDVADAASDTTNGLSINYNNDNGYIFYTNNNCITFR